MKRLALIIMALFGLFSCKAKSQNTEKIMSGTTFYDLKATDIDGNVFDFSQLKGKKILIVNVASKCGYTPQYEDLEKLYQEYKDQNFVILGFPCNQFMWQEPGDENDIKSFCSLNYGVTFPLFSKIDVKGSDQSAVYQWLTKKELNGVEDSKVSWNFNKYLIDENGNYVKHLESKVKPLDAEITDWLKK